MSQISYRMTLRKNKKTKQKLIEKMIELKKNYKKRQN